MRMKSVKSGIAGVLAALGIASANAQTPALPPAVTLEEQGAVQFLAQAPQLEPTKDTAPLRRHFAEYIKKWGARGGVDRLIMAEVRLGELLWQAACPITELDGLCSSASTAAPPANEPAACEGPQVLPFSQQPPRARQAALLQAAMEHLDKAITLYQSGESAKQIPLVGDAAARQERLATLQFYVATAMLLQADHSFEKLLGIRMPTGLVLDPKRVKENKESIDRFRTYVEQKSKLLGEAQKRFQAVVALRQPTFVVAAAGRIGQLFQDFAEELDNARIPAPPPPPEQLAPEEWRYLFHDAYCDQMQDTAQPLTVKAVEAFKLCVEKARSLQQSGPLVQRCVTALEKLGESLPVAAADRPSGPEVVGSLSPERIRDAVGVHLSDVQSCVQMAAPAKQTMSGQVTIKWKITAAGGVETASLESSTVKDPEIEQCILTLVKSWTFPAPQGGSVVTTYPFAIRANPPDSPASAGTTAEIKGSLSKYQIRARIREHIGEVKACYEKGAVQRKLEGRVLVKFLIAASGTVAAASMEDSTLHDAETEKCIVTTLKTWTFPRPQSGAVVVSYPFLLKTAG